MNCPYIGFTKILFKGFTEDGLHEVFGELFAVFNLLFYSNVRDR